MRSISSLGPLPRSDAVLVVEEDRALADLIRVSLRRHGFNVSVVFDIDDLDHQIDRFDPMVILLDLFLPGTNGLDLLALLKRSGKLNRRHVILISAYGFTEVIEQSVEVGAVDFVIKPVNVDVLVQKVMKWSERD